MNDEFKEKLCTLCIDCSMQLQYNKYNNNNDINV